jgi:Ribonucleotide reductase, alpha subunit
MVTNYQEDRVSLATLMRTYTRGLVNGKKESWVDVVERVVSGLESFGGLTYEEVKEIRNNLSERKSLASGRMLWVGGTDWSKNPKNFPGLYNCSSTEINDISKFGLIGEFCMTGCGIGANLELHNIEQLPKINTRINLSIIGAPGDIQKEYRAESTKSIFHKNENIKNIIVGDSREGWIDAYQEIINTAVTIHEKGEVNVVIVLGNVRPRGEIIKGFGGKANPDGLMKFYQSTAMHLNKAVGRKMNSIEVCLLINEVGAVVEYGGVRRSAQIMQFSENDKDSVDAKLNLWKEENGVWHIDPEIEAMRMANHTRVYDRKPTLDEVETAITKQFHTGEGAIMYAPEAIARANADILPTLSDRKEFVEFYVNHSHSEAEEYVKSLGRLYLNEEFSDYEVQHRLSRKSLNPCGEVISTNFFCNLSEVMVSLLNPFDFNEQKSAFRSAALMASPLLKHVFTHKSHQKSRELDPIVGVSISGVFDFFVMLFQDDYLLWTDAGRPEDWEIKDFDSLYRLRYIAEQVGGTKFLDDNELGKFYVHIEEFYYKFWRDVVEDNVRKYCEREGLRVPNRSTLIQPSGTKSLLVNSSPGIHPTWGDYWIRRIKFIKEDPVAQKYLEAGYSYVQSQNDIAMGTNSEVIIEFPCRARWRDFVKDETVEQIDLYWNAVGMYRFTMNAQKNYVGHNTSVTINFDESEIKPLANEIYNSIQNNEGYISAALLPKCKDIFPNLPFEKISKEKYEIMISNLRLVTEEKIIEAHYQQHNKVDYNRYQSACSSGSCQLNG